MILSNGGDLEGVTRVEDIKYMRYLRTLMSQIAAWPGHAIGQPIGRWKMYKMFLDVNACACLLGGILFIKNNFGLISVYNMVITYITVFMTIMCCARSFTIWRNKYNTVFKDFIQIIHLFNIRNTTPYCMEIHLYVHKFSHGFILYMMSTTVFAYTIFNVIPIVTTVNNGGFEFPHPHNVTYELSVYYALPFDYIHNFNGYMVVSILNWYESYLASCYFVMIDLYLGLLMFHLWGHLKILVYDLENFPRPNGECIEFLGRYSDEELTDVRKRIKAIVEHHNQILKFIQDVSDAFGPAIAISYAYHQVSWCILLFVCSQQGSAALVRFGPMSVVLFLLLVQMSLIFELVGSMRDRLINAVYALPWECMDTCNRRSVVIILQQVQRPLGLKAMGMVEVGCNTMVAILKTSISYFAMLRTMTMD